MQRNNMENLVVSQKRPTTVSKVATHLETYTRMQPINIFCKMDGHIFPSTSVVTWLTDISSNTISTIDADNHLQVGSACKYKTRNSPQEYYEFDMNVTLKPTLDRMDSFDNDDNKIITRLRA